MHPSEERCTLRYSHDFGLCRLCGFRLRSRLLLELGKRRTASLSVIVYSRHLRVTSGLVFRQIELIHAAPAIPRG